LPRGKVDPEANRARSFITGPFEERMPTGCGWDKRIPIGEEPLKKTRKNNAESLYIELEIAPKQLCHSCELKKASVGGGKREVDTGTVRGRRFLREETTGGEEALE